MSWEEKISGCFGFVDKQFALHHSDGKHAAQLLAAANAENVGFNEFCQEIENWLVNQGCNKEHIDQEMERVRDIKSYFNYD